MNKFEKEQIVELLTKHINRCLKRSSYVEDWCFSVTLDGRYSLNVQIDYIDNFHSRDMILIRDDHKLDYDTMKELKSYFEWCFKRHIDELADRMKEKI